MILFYYILPINNKVSSKRRHSDFESSKLKKSYYDFVSLLTSLFFTL